MENTKKSFPIASVLFILYFIANLVRISLNAISNIISYTENGTSVFTSFLYEIPLISAILFLIPFLLVGFFSLKASQKPNIGYIISLALTIFVPCISIVGTIIFITLPSAYMSASSISTIVANSFFFIALVTALAYAIIAKASKKPSKLFKLWFLFPVPSVIYFITQAIASSISIAGAIETYMAYTPYSYAPGVLSGIFSLYNERTYEETITYLIFHISGAVLLVLGILILTTAFFCISRQFAKVNKSLVIAEKNDPEEAPEITE